MLWLMITLISLAQGDWRANPAVVHGYVEDGGRLRPIEWDSVPTLGAIASAYPKGQSGFGEATISCQISKDGRLTGCAVKSQNTNDGAFGRAALCLASQFQVSSLSMGTIGAQHGRVELSLAFVREDERFLPPEPGRCIPPLCIIEPPPPPPPPPKS